MTEKQRKDLRNWIGVIITLLVLFASFVTTQAYDRKDIGANSHNHAELKADLCPRMKCLEEHMVEQRTDIKWIREKLDKE